VFHPLCGTVSGVSANAGRWRAQISVKGKPLYINSFESEVRLVYKNRVTACATFSCFASYTQHLYAAKSPGVWASQRHSVKELLGRS
jgi:hypothetical protein